MAPPVRIYFSILDTEAAWSHEVYRDVTSLRDSWKQRQKDSNWQLCVLHVGYDRPHYNTESLLEVISDIDRPVLMTEAARWALPGLYAICAHAPVAYCAIHNRSTECPVYLAIKEWGYELAADDFMQATALPAAMTGEVTGWVKILSEEQPKLAAPLFKVGIDSEEQYIKKRHLLARQDLEAADNFRFQHFRSSIDRSDPFAILKIAPLWLLDSDIKRLNFTVRLSNVFSRENVSIVRDIQKYTREDLMKLPNFGRKSLMDMADTLLAAFDEHQSFGKAADDLTLAEHLQHSLGLLPEPAKQIITARLGADGNRPLILQELGDIYGVTRERIRQIEKKYLSKIIEKELWDDLLAHKLEVILSTRKEPLFLDMVEVEDPWFKGFNGKPEYFAEIISRFSAQKISVIEYENQKIVSRLDQSTFDNLIKEFRSSLEENTRSGWTKKYIRETIATKCLGYGAQELNGLVWDSIADTLHFSQGSNGEEVLVGIGRSADNLVKVVLEEAPEPLHYSEIHSRVSKQTDRTVDIRRVHTALTASPDAMLYGRGTYGLKKHLPFNKEQITEILGMAEEIILSGPKHKQWHLAELLQTMYEEDYKIPQGLNTYMLGVILTESSKLISLGKQVWVSKYQDNLSNNDRIQTMDAFILILEREGHPLSTQDIIDKVSAYRGVKPTTQIHPNEVLVRLSADAWGIVQRDVPLTLEQRKKLLDIIHDHLSKTSQGMHISELEALFEKHQEHLPTGLDPYVFLSLCGIDDRFRVWLGRLIGLSSWDTPRRQTFASAFRTVYERQKTPTTVEEMHKKVEQVLGRSIDKRKVANGLSASGGIYDRDSGLWSNPNYVEAKDTTQFPARTADEFRMASSA